MTTHWLDNGPEGWMVPTVLDVSDAIVGSPGPA